MDGLVAVQARSMAAKSPKIARWANIIAGLVLMAFSVPFGLLGGGRWLAANSTMLCLLARKWTDRTSRLTGEVQQVGVDATWQMPHQRHCRQLITTVDRVPLHRRM